jgi:eukaryotic-like serine/threonine-protein kinase
MPVPDHPPALFRFGLFDVDLHSGELRKQGRIIRIQDLPFRVLAALLQRPLELVTREELRSQLWPSDTFVDFDNSLNAAINKLRDALGDSADSPRFIETLPRRGYRFIAEVTATSYGAETTSSGKGVASRSHQRSIPAVLAAILILAIVGIASLWHIQRKLRLTDQDTILLADFSNTTGDPIFDDTLKQALRAVLEQSPFLNILSDEKVSEELQLMGRPKDQRVTPDIAREVCQRTGSKAILVGSISSLGTHYAIGLNAINCHTADNLGSEHVEADRREHVLTQLGSAATRMRKKLGESLPTIQKYDAPIEQVTTSSLEALEAYCAGIKVYAQQGNAPAVPFFQRAVVLDPSFAMAYARLGALYSDINPPLSTENIRKAYDLRGKVSERERLYIEAHYYRDVTGELDKAASLWEVRQQIYPREDESYTNLTIFYAQRGNYEKALEEAREALRLDPDDQDNYVGVVYIYMSLNRLDEAQSALREAEQRHLDGGNLLAFRYGVAFLKNQAGEMDRLLLTSADNEAAGQFPLWRAEVELYHGKLRKAREVLQPLEPNCIQSCALLCLREAYFGLTRLARSDALAALKTDPTTIDHFPWLPLALALAIAGDVPQAEKLALHVGKDQPLRTEVQRDWLPLIRAAVALGQNNPGEAVDLLRPMGPYELGPLELMPIYERGQAYLMLHNGTAAASEFQKIIDHPGIVAANPVGVLAHLGLARALAIERDTSKSRTAYEDFFTLWKDADPDIPILLAARSEYAKLH